MTDDGAIFIDIEGMGSAMIVWHCDMSTNAFRKCDVFSSFIFTKVVSNNEKVCSGGVLGSTIVPTYADACKFSTALGGCATAG